MAQAYELVDRPRPKRSLSLDSIVSSEDQEESDPLQKNQPWSSDSDDGLAAHLNKPLPSVIPDEDNPGNGLRSGEHALLHSRSSPYPARKWLSSFSSRSCCLSTLIAVFAILSFLVAGGFWAYKRGTDDGQSPSYYPTPLGGTTASWQDSYRKAADMVSRMSLVEKVNITTGTGWEMGMCVGNTGPANTVGFPSLCLQDGPLGLRFVDNITASPAGITVGATWNKELMYKRGRMLGIESRAKGVNVLLGPCVGPLGRMPAGGRNWEGFGSDPVLQGVAGAETIRGIQDEGVMATIKHFVGNEQEHFRQSFEWGLPNAMSSNIDDRTLHELYAWPFMDAVRAGVASVMCSYNQVNNSYACQNSKLLNGVLKDELGFQGFIQSDWLAARSGVASALAGLDMSMPGDGLLWADGVALWGSRLTQAVLNESVPLERLNDMVTRIVASWYQLGQDSWPKSPPDGDGGPNFSSWTDDETGLLHPGSDDNITGVVNQFVHAGDQGNFSHSALSRRIAAEGMVLLKNDDAILPLDRSGHPVSRLDPDAARGRRRRIAVFGDDAFPNKNGPNACADRACWQGTLASGWGSGAVNFPYLVTPVDALQRAFDEEDVELSLFPDNDMSRENETTIEQQDLCIVFVSATSGEGFAAVQGIKGDRNDLNLQKEGDELIEYVSARCGIHSTTDWAGSHNGKTIVVIHNVGPVIVESFISSPSVAAVLLANLPGQESGDALTDVLFGNVNPSGHLPYTMGKSLADYGPGAEVLYYPNGIVPQQNFTEGLFIDYRHFDEERSMPRFEFGFGLSYTTFSFGDVMAIRPVDPSRPSPLLPPPPDDGAAPPTYDTTIPPASSALFPNAFRRLTKYIYPYLTPSEAQDIHKSPPLYPLDATSLQSPAGGGQGGHPALWEVLAYVDIDVHNDGVRSGQAVIQLYIVFPDNVYDTDETATGDASSADDVPGGGAAGAAGDAMLGFGGRGDGKADDSERHRRGVFGARGDKVRFPRRVLRAFEKVHLRGSAEQAGEDGGRGGETKTVTLELTRRDLSFWSVVRQTWVLPEGGFGVEVGFSSRDIRLRGRLF